MQKRAEEIAMLGHYIRDRAPKLLHVKVTPDPVLQGQLAQKLEAASQQVRSQRISRRFRFQPVTVEGMMR